MDKLKEAPKPRLREWALARRSAIPDRTAKAVSICTQLSALSALEGVRAVMVFAAMRAEIDLWPWVEARLAEGVTVAYPVCLPSTKEIEPRAITRRDELLPGTWGILEPGPEAPMIAAPELDAVIVPGLIFDRSGYRIGYGAGYYDRFLPQLRQGAVSVGVTYGELFLPAVPHEPHDVAVEWVVTEDGAWRSGTGA